MCACVSITSKKICNILMPKYQNLEKSALPKYAKDCVCVCAALNEPSVPWIHYAGSQNSKLKFLHSCLLPPSSPRKRSSLDSKNNTKPNELFGIVVTESCEHHNQRAQCRVCRPAEWTTDGISGRWGSWFRDVCTQPILLLIKGEKSVFHRLSFRVSHFLYASDDFVYLSNWKFISLCSFIKKDSYMCVF